MSYSEHLAKNRRICILRTLSSAPGYRSNESLLHAVVEDFGVPASRDQIRTDLAWLSDQGLLTLEEIADIYVVQVTQAGLDVAAGRTTVPGVQRPSPR